MNLVIIGGGNMGAAMADSLIKTKALAPSELLIIETLSERRQYLTEQLGCQIRENIDNEISGYQAVLIAVKPQAASETMQKIAPFLAEKQVVLSIMAGISIAQMVRELQHNSVIRIMPNTPAQIGEGMSVYYATPEVNHDQLNFTQSILKANGSAFAVNDEDGIDAATAVSGSGPAYIFYIAEQIVASAIKLGFSEKEANQLTQQTIKGAVLLWESQSTPVDELRRRVTSPGGTTEAALQSFEKNEIGKKFQEGLQSAYQRAKVLAQNQ
ncbi:MAG: pyrroline-5-carboxylate reductase [SAR324 cluster bacterium]|nr:pyrroline-5-carboxylate reductase [SAR324 cluster bacterium]